MIPDAPMRLLRGGGDPALGLEDGHGRGLVLPIENIREMLLTGKHATEEDLKALDKEIKDIVNDSAEFAKDSPEPDLAELWTDIYADELPQGSAEENA